MSAWFHANSAVLLRVMFFAIVGGAWALQIFRTGRRVHAQYPGDKSRFLADVAISFGPYLACFGGGLIGAAAAANLMGADLVISALFIFIAACFALLLLSPRIGPMQRAKERLIYAHAQAKQQDPIVLSGGERARRAVQGLGLK